MIDAYKQRKYLIQNVTFSTAGTKRYEIDVDPAYRVVTACAGCPSGQDLPAFSQRIEYTVADANKVVWDFSTAVDNEHIQFCVISEPADLNNPDDVTASDITV